MGSASPRLRLPRLARHAALLVATLWGAPLAAQRTTELSAFGSVQLVTGGAYMDIEALNARYNKAGYNTISNDAIAFGIAAYGAWGSTLIGLEHGVADFGEEGAVSGRVNRLKSSHTMLQVGYAVIQKNWVQLYPYLGVGGGKVNIFARDAGAATVAPDSSLISALPTFDNVISRAGRDGLWVNGGFLLFEPGIGADFLFRRRAADRLGLVMGVRVGNRIAPNNTTWKWSGRSVVAGPDTGPGGTYVRVTFGIGG